MKDYNVGTHSGWEFVISANNYREAVSIGRAVCRRSGERFSFVRLKRKP